MQVMVTGGAGFIGSHIVEYHLSKGDIVYTVDNLDSGCIENISPFQKNKNFHFLKQDILAWQDIKSDIANIDRIYHMAAIVGVYKVIQEPMRVLEVNIRGTQLLLDAIKSTQKKIRVILASSSEVYGPSNEPKLQEDGQLIIDCAAKNRWNYAVSKLTDEAMGLSFQQEFGIPITPVRLFNTIGLRQTGRYGMVIPRFILQAIHNEPITVFGDGQQTRSFCDVRDTVKILDLVANSDKCIGQIINVGNDREVTINQLAQMVKDLAGSHSELQHISYEKAYGAPYIDIKRRRPDLKKLFSLINFQHQWQLEDSLRYLIAQHT